KDTKGRSRLVARPEAAMTVDAAAPKSAMVSARRRAALEFLLDNLVWLILLVVLAFFAATIPNFFQIGILLNILEQSTFVSIIAVGLSLTLIAGQMDLSVESVLGLTAMATALVFGQRGAGGGLELHPAWLALPA